MRVGMRYVRGMRESVARAIVKARARAPFTSIDDLTRRVPELQKRELIVLAEIGALNFLNPAELRGVSRERRGSSTLPFHRQTRSGRSNGQAGGPARYSNRSMSRIPFPRWPG